MAWTSQSSDTYICPVGGVEDFFLKTCPHVPSINREHWTVSLDATLSFASFDRQAAFDRVRLSWASLRFQQPNIATSLDKVNDQKVYEVPDKAKLKSWLDATCRLVVDSRDVDALMSNAKQHPLPVVYYIEPTHTVTIQASHWRVDGIGLLMLMDCLLTLIGNPLPVDDLSWGSETVNLTPPIEAALCLPLSLSEEGEEYGRNTTALLASRLPSAGVAYRGDNNTAPGLSRRTALVLPRLTTRALTEAARSMDVTLTNIIQSALAMSVFEHIDSNTKDRGFTVLLGHDLRRHMTEPYCAHSYAANVYVGAEFSHCPLGLHKSFSETAKNYRKQVTDFSPATFMSSLRSVPNYWIALLTAAPPDDFPALSEPQFSSAGRADRYIKHDYKDATGETAFSVSRVRIFLDMLSRQLMLHALTWKDQLILNLCYNEAYHDLASAREFLETLRAHLERGTGVEVDAVAV